MHTDYVPELYLSSHSEVSNESQYTSVHDESNFVSAGIRYLFH